MPQGDERAFRQWYASMASRYGLAPDPDDPQQFYDYRAAFRAGAQPDASGHWPSDFKRPGHPNMVVGGFNVQTGERVAGTPRAPDAAALVRLGWDPQTAQRLMSMPEPTSVPVRGTDGKDKVADFLRMVPTSDRLRAAAWDAVHESAGDDDLQQRLSALPFDDRVKAQLWDLAHEAQAPEAASVAALDPSSLKMPSGRTISTAGMPPDVAAQLSRVSSGESLNDPDVMLSNVDRGVDLLPAAGGMVGGTIGGAVGNAPGAVGGAALGGATGESARQLIRRAQGREAPATSMEAATAIGKEGVIQGAAEGVGRGVAYGAGKAGRWMMNRALNTTERLSREFPDLSQTMIDNALSVSQGGLRRARALLVQAKARANAAVAAADAQGVRIPVSAVTQGLNKTLGEISKGADREGGLRALVQVEQKLLAGRGSDMTVAEADALKTSLQTEANQLYRQIAQGEGRPTAGIVAKAKADMAAAINDAIEAVTQQAGAGGYRASNAEAQQLIGATRGIRHAVRPGSNLYQAMVRPGVGAMLGGGAGYQQGGFSGAAAGALTGAITTSPGTLSREALLLTNPAIQALLQQLPRATAEAVKRDIRAQSATREPGQP